jgi:hypothetical protein
MGARPAPDTAVLRKDLLAAVGTLRRMTRELVDHVLKIVARRG